ncbi:MAG TPA: hypothetical protein EYG68_11835 [Leucothrix mucor]|nr:hypothetical protein [Leucothrix mucor]
MNKYFLAAFFLLTFSITVSAEILPHQRQNVVSSINNSYIQISKSMKTINKIARAQTKAQQELNRMKPMLVMQGVSYCYQSLLSATQKRKKLMATNKQQLIRTQVLLSNLRTSAYQAKDIFQLNNVINKINILNRQTNLLVKKQIV